MFKKLEDVVRGYRWPRRGDRLLRSSNQWDKDVTFSPYRATRDAYIWTGYMRAGAILVEEAHRAGTRRPDDLLYPILFCYRHGLEVAMKWILNEYGRYVDVECKLNHDLWRLWQACKKVIIEIGEESADDDAIEVVEGIVKEFHDLDPAAFALRYSTNKKGTTIDLPDDPIDLENVKDVMEAVNNFFTGADGLLDHNTPAIDY